MKEKKIKIRLFGKPEVTIEREAIEGEAVKSESVELGIEWPTLALFILWRNRGDVDSDTLVDVLKPRSKAGTDRNSFIKKHKTRLRQRLNLELPETLKLTILGPAILEQAWVDVVEFDAMIGGSNQELEEAIALRRHGPLLVNLTEPAVFIKEREAREEKYREALWQLFQANSGPDPVDARRFARLLLKSEGLPEDRTAFLQEQIRKLEHQLFQLKSGTEAEKTTRPQRLPALPNFPTELIGREAEIAQIAEILINPGLVTLTGTAGIGKTRVAAAVARRLAENLPDGAVWVDLTAASDAEQMVQQVSAALGLREEPVRPVRNPLPAFLEDKTLLLVWDNCEHIADACAALANDILSRCPSLRLLATSREWLRAYGERLHEISLLPSDSAVRLFLARAQAVQPKFQITEQNQPAILKICQDLDGLPLALELAAALMDMHDVFWIAENLHRRFELLTDGSRAGVPRHASLQIGFDFSYDLLPPVEQSLFRALGVFVGSFRTDAAEAVAAMSDTETLLRQLVRKSLVLRVDAEEEPRFRLLASVQQYAEQHLEAHGEADTARRRHRDFFLALAEETEPQLRGPEQKRLLDRLETEHDNFRASLAWEERWRNDGKDGLRLAGALSQFWDMRGHYSEGRQWLGRALARTKPGATGLDGATGQEPSVGRAEALRGAGFLAYRQGDYVSARALQEEALTLFRQLGNQQGIARSLGNLGNVASNQGDYVSARALQEEALALFRQLWDQSSIATALGNLGLVAERQGDYAGARALQEEALTINRQSGNQQGIARSLGNLGNVAERQGDYAGARALQEEALTINRQLGHQSGIAITLMNLGNVASIQGDYARARALYEEGLTIRRQLGDKNGIAHTLLNLGVMTQEQGDWGAARVLYQEALTISRPLGDQRSTANALSNLGDVAFRQGDYAGAQTLMEESLTIRRQLEDQGGIADSLDSMAIVAQGQHQPLRAALLEGAASVLRESIKIPRPPMEQAEVDKTIVAVREALGEATFAAAWDAGRAMSWEQAVAFALGEDAP